jgi:hypothetical protein
VLLPRVVSGLDDMSAMSVDPLSMKSVLDRVELLEKSYQEERLAVRAPNALLSLALSGSLPLWPACLTTCSLRPRSE